jgi:antitoxin ParD1/3/4
MLFCMASLNVSMPDELRDFVTRRTKETHHATPTEYIRSLVREDQKRADHEHLEKLLLEGLESGKGSVIKDLDSHFAKKKQSLLEKLKKSLGK